MNAAQVPSSTQAANPNSSSYSDSPVYHYNGGRRNGYSGHSGGYGRLRGGRHGHGGPSSIKCKKCHRFGHDATICYYEVPDYAGEWKVIKSY